MLNEEALVTDTTIVGVILCSIAAVLWVRAYLEDRRELKRREKELTDERSEY